MLLLRQVYAALVFIPGTLFVASAILFGALVRIPRPWMDKLSRAFGYTALVATMSRVKHVVWHSEANSWANRLVIVSNHESHLDGPGIQTTLEMRSIRYVAKEALFKIPFLGWGLRAAGNVPVSRRGVKSDQQRLNEPKEREKDGDVLFFAEGTRSREGVFQSFKKGAFYFAITHQRPILPIAVCGGYECMAPGTLRLMGGDLALSIGEPIDVSKYGLDDVDVLRERVREEIEKLRIEALGLIDSPRLQESTGDLSQSRQQSQLQPPHQSFSISA